MEGSVQNLLKAEQEAKQIVADAMKESQKISDKATTKGKQAINEKRNQWEQRLNDDAQVVSIQARECLMICVRVVGAKERRVQGKGRREAGRAGRDRPLLRHQQGESHQHAA